MPPRIYCTWHWTTSKSISGCNNAWSGKFEIYDFWCVMPVAANCQKLFGFVGGRSLRACFPLMVGIWVLEAVYRVDIVCRQYFARPALDCGNDQSGIDMRLWWFLWLSSVLTGQVGNVLSEPGSDIKEWPTVPAWSINLFDMQSNRVKVEIVV